MLKSSNLSLALINQTGAWFDEAHFLALTGRFQRGTIATNTITMLNTFLCLHFGLKNCRNFSCVSLYVSWVGWTNSAVVRNDVVRNGQSYIAFIWHRNTNEPLDFLSLCLCIGVECNYFYFVAFASLADLHQMAISAFSLYQFHCCFYVCQTMYWPHPIVVALTFFWTKKMLFLVYSIYLI